MIKYNYEVSVNENRAKLNKDIFLFRGNRNIHYYFSIKGARFAFEKEGDLIENANAIYAAVTVIKPNGVEVANAIAPVENGLIHLKVTEDLIDEEVEIGDFDLVFDLFDDSDGAVTIPKIKGQFHVQERPCTTSIGTLSGNVNVVNQAVVDLAIATQENEQLIVVDDDGKYVKTTWAKGNKISVERLNKMEEGIYNNSSQLKDIANELDKIVITGGGLSTTEKNLILTLFKNATYSVDMSNTVNTLETLFNGGSTDNDTYTITNNLTNVSTSNTVASINKGSSYTAILTPNEGYTLGTIVVTMGGIDVTSSVVSNNTIEISSVTGNIVITASNTQSSSESTNWTNEVPYKITPINSEYINKDNGEVVQYEGWARTDYLGCYGASKIKIVWTTSSRYGAFYDINKQFIFNFNSCINQDESVAATIVLNVPENAGYFRASNSANALTNATITPYA